jgi:hypothetical protein
MKQKKMKIISKIN